MNAFRTKLHGLPLSTKVALMILVALVALSSVTYVATRNVLLASAEARADERQDANMQVAWHVLQTLGGDFHVQGDDLYAGQVKLNDNDAPVDKIKQLVGAKATIFRGDMRVATNVTKDDGSRAVGTPLAKGPVYDTVLGKGQPYRGRADILGQSYFTAYDPIKAADGTVLGVLFVGVPADQFLADANAVGNRQLVIALVVTLVAGMACLWLTRSMFRPVDGMRRAMEALAKGDHGIDVPGTQRQDEVGAMARAVLHFREAAVAKEKAEAAAKLADADQQQVVTALNAALGRLADGDLTADLGRDFPASYAAVRTNFEDALEALRTLVGAVAESATAINSGSGEIARASEDLARRTESNAASLEQTSAALGEMDQRLKIAATAAEQTVVRADEAIATVDTGRAVTDSAVQAMSRVSDSAKGIDTVIEGLDKIAFQTRVLAMNAAVEAGRAGEAGRGFAVVADLVSALAMRAEEEAKRARDQLSATQADIGSAVDMVQKVDAALAGIATGVGEVHTLLGTMAAENLAQSSAISQINTAIGTMDVSTQQNAAMVEQTSAAARTLAADVSGLAEQASRFNTGRASAPRGPAARKPAPAAPAYVSPVKPLPAAAVKALTRPSDDDWTSF
jgi:methyl-accepting chemotaxis protein